MAEINLGRVKGDKGDTGADGLTTSVKLGEVDYSHVDGVISLPAYPSKTSELVNDAGFLTTYNHNHDDRYYTETETDTKIATAKTEAIADSKTWAKGVFSNPNLLRNANFKKPINQRGLNTYTVPTSGFAYTIDGWRVSSGTLTLGVNGVSLTSSTEGQWFYQMLEEDLKGKTVTFSAEIDGIVHVVTGIAPSANNEFITGDGIIVAMINGYTSVIVQMKTTTITPSWAKLELGSVATPFVPRPYGEELALCRRYFYTQKFVLSSPYAMVAIATTTLTGNILFPTSMRITPTLTNLTFRSNVNGEVLVATGFTVQSGADGINAIYNVTFATGNFTVGHWYTITFDAHAEL